MLKKLSLLLVPVSFCAGLLTYNFIARNNCINNLNLVEDVSLIDNSLVFNDKTVNLANPFLSIVEYDSLTDSYMKSNLVELMECMENQSMYISSMFNHLAFSEYDGNYPTFNSSSIKVRYSSLDDGYLLEVNNKIGGELVYYYDINGAIYTNSNDIKGDFWSIDLKDGLSQFKVTEGVDINTLSKNLMSL